MSDGSGRIGILLANSGTPASADARDVRRFLAAFLSDPRVIETPRAIWLPILHGVILRTRPRRSASKYRKIWTPEGSPLLVYSEKLRRVLLNVLGPVAREPISVELGMLYGAPSVPQALRTLREAGAERLLILPLFPQYCAASTGAVYDQVTAELRRWRSLPDVRFVSDYHDEASYIDALCASVDDHWRAHGRTRHLLMSFHGIPESYAKRGDPYPERCKDTARLLAAGLGLQPAEWSVSFQSRVGAARWLQPYTSTVVRELPKRGLDEITVICPGFAVDCLETLEEIEIENRALFMKAGGRTYHYVPSLNATPAHARVLAAVVAKHAQGWSRSDGAPRAVEALHGAPV